MWNKLNQNIRKTQLYARTIYTLLKKQKPQVPKSKYHFEYDSRKTWQVLSILINASIIATVTEMANKSHCDKEIDVATGVDCEKHHTVTNWSGNHTCNAERVFEPRSAQEVLRLLQTTHQHNMKHPDAPIRIRPIGTGLSPNGIGMHSACYPSKTSNSTKEEVNLISVHGLDYIEVDKKNQLVTVGAGVTVNDLLLALDKHGLTLQNFSSITEQTVAGWTQVAAHGTGIYSTTVDDMIVRLQLATPTEGLLTLSATSNAELFQYAKVGLGSLGIVTELTLKCVPKYQLRQYLHVFPSLKEMQREHYDRLVQYQHVKYLLFPYTHAVMTIAAHPPNQLPPAQDKLHQLIQHHVAQSTPPTVSNTATNSTVTAPASASYFPWEHHPAVTTLPTKALLRLLYQTDRTLFQPPTATGTTGTTEQDGTAVPAVCRLPYTQLREVLLTYAPLNVNLLKSLAQAEVSYWEQAAVQEGKVPVIADSNEILRFDCGGHQLVYEFCFPIGTIEEVRQKQTDIHFLQSLMQQLHTQFIPAHCPIEVRYTAANTDSVMSPAYSKNPKDLFCWVGIIMYLPTPTTEMHTEEETVRQHALITEMFGKYRRALQPLYSTYNAVGHWAKIEYNQSSAEGEQSSNNQENSWWGRLFGAKQQSSNAGEEIENIRIALQKRYPVQSFNTYRTILDPTGILSTPFLNTIFTNPTSSSTEKKE